MSTTRPPVFDERFAAPVEASRRGAHRARPNPLLGVLPVVAGTAIVVLVVVSAWAVFGRDTPSSSGSGTVAAATETTPAGAATPSATQTTIVAPTTTRPASSATSTAGTVDKSIEIRVLNSISVTGLAKRVATKLTDAGWTATSGGNSSTRNLSETRVYYGSKSDKATAVAIVADLGFGSTKQSSSAAGSGITVVLGQDAANE